jgi:porin
MGSRAGRSGILATAVLVWWMLLGGPARGQEDRPEPAALPLPPVERLVEPGDSPNFDAGQETPAPPVTPAPASYSYADGPLSSRFLLGDLYGLRRLSEELGLAVHTSLTQFERGVAAGGLHQAFAWGGKFDMLAHLDTNNLGLWEGGTLDLFAESRLGQSMDGYAGTFSPPNLAMFFPVHNQQLTAITGLKFTQAITERSGIFFGKLNALNGDPEKFVPGPGPCSGMPSSDSWSTPTTRTDAWAYTRRRAWAMAIRTRSDGS